MYKLIEISDELRASNRWIEAVEDFKAGVPPSNIMIKHDLSVLEFDVICTEQQEYRKNNAMPSDIVVMQVFVEFGSIEETYQHFYNCLTPSELTRIVKPLIPLLTGRRAPRNNH